MARKRMISPNIWEDPAFNKLSIGARLLFIGMFSNADDEGYLREDTGSLKRLVFGFDMMLPDMDKWVLEVEQMKNIHFYEVDGEKYCHFLNWSKYQKQQKDRIQGSSYPKCSICVASDKQMLTEVKISKVKLSKDSILPTNVGKAEYGDPEINKVISFLKEKLGGSLDGPVKENRRFANLLLKRIKKDYPDKDSASQICALIDFGLQDSFHAKNITNFKYLYYNAQKIIQSVKSQITSPKLIKI